jgi:GntR family transcriptional regulator, transcriptional repressor for pyruvate dehydrogenase complex
MHRKTEKVAEVVAREIVHDMVDLEPYTKLPAEAEMLQKYGIGRASLREALRILEVQGLLVIRVGPGGGPIVAPIDSRNFARMTSLYLFLSRSTYRDVVEGRLVMEPMMARLAADRGDASDFVELRRFSPSAGALLDDAKYLQRSTDFHALLSGMSGNPVLDFMGRALKDIYMNRVSDMVFPIAEREKVEHDHAAIADAIVNGEADEAESLMRDHMVEYVKYAEQRHPGILDQVIDWR